MKKKQIMAMLMALAVVASVGVPTLKVEAEGLTQATDASSVTYGKLSKADINMLKGMFDFDYYKAQNPELALKLGDNYDKLFEHFYKCGVFEGRTCNSNFDPAAYASAYGDLKDKYGADIIKYYEHFSAFGASENRTLTTIAACAEAGITVEGLANDNVKITPVAYKLALILGTNDFQTVQAAVNNAVRGSSNSSSGSSSSSSSSSSSTNESTPATTVIQTNQGTYVLVPNGGDADAYSKAKGLTKIGQISVSEQPYTYNQFNIYIVKGTTGYAAFDDKYPSDSISSISSRNRVVYQTSDYSGDIEKVIGAYEVHSTNEALREADKKKGGYTGELYYEATGETSTSEVDNGNRVSTYYYYQREKTGQLTYSSSYNNQEGETATDYKKCHNELVGYYTNSDATEKHEFADVAERDAYLSEHGINIDSNSTEKYYGTDTKGDASSSYDIGMEIKQNEDGSLESISVGVSNDETGFGYVSTRTAEELADPATQQTNE